MRVTEEHIRGQLDGWFFTLDHAAGRTRNIKVPDDYIPHHKAVYMVDIEERHPMARKWTQHEDDVIVTLRESGKTWAVVSKAIGVSQTCALNRYQEICIKRGVEPVSNEATRPRKIPKAVADQIVEMKQQGMTSREISEVVGFTPKQVIHVCTRARKREAA
jgi:lambda repressor-like predicted transcriptional regulator